MTSTAKVDLPVDLKTAYYADRRLSYGPGSKFFEDYDRRYDEEQVTNLLYHSYLEIKSLVKRLNIDKVACFLPTTFLDVITLQVCDELDIKKAVIRGSKIDNYVITADALDGSSSQLNDAYAAARFSQDTIEQARNYLVRASQGVVCTRVLSSVSTKGS